MRRLRKRRNRRRAPYGAAVFFLWVLGTPLYVTGALASQEDMAHEGAGDSKEQAEAQETLNTTKEKGSPLIGEDYVYQATGKTDPFKSFIAEPEPVEEKKPKRPKTYLETLELSQLDLIAIILSPKGNWGMVRDAKGTGYVIRKGTPIGTNEGVVHEIREKEIVVREIHRDYLGRGKVRDITKKLISSP